MDENENARLREEGRSAAQNGLQVNRSIGRDSRGLLLPTDVFRADQPFRDGYTAERDRSREMAKNVGPDGQDLA
jgi:hypothetical protein